MQPQPGAPPGGAGQQFDEDDDDDEDESEDSDDDDDDDDNGDQIEGKHKNPDLLTSIILDHCER